LILRAADVTVDKEMDLDLLVKYANGESEKLHFFVVSRNVPSNTKAERALQYKNWEVES
jgi:hypothetical protein